MMFTFVTVTEEHARRFIELARRELGNVNWITATVLPTFEPPFKPPYFSPYLFNEPMLTMRGDGFTIRAI